MRISGILKSEVWPQFLTSLPFSWGASRTGLVLWSALEKLSLAGGERTCRLATGLCSFSALGFEQEGLREAATQLWWRAHTAQERRASSQVPGQRVENSLTRPQRLSILPMGWFCSSPVSAFLPDLLCFPGFEDCVVCIHCILIWQERDIKCPQQLWRSGSIKEWSVGQADPFFPVRWIFWLPGCFSHGVQIH